MALSLVNLRVGTADQRNLRLRALSAIAQIVRDGGREAALPTPPALRIVSVRRPD